MTSTTIQLLLQYLLPKKLLTILAGVLADVKINWVKNILIRSFVKKYQIDLAQASKTTALAYENFNDFFTRHLKPGIRPIADTNIVSPVDGFVSEFGSIQQGQLLQAKGKYYSLETLVALPKAQSDLFQSGSFVTLYLSPKDYHRVHMPMDGILQTMKHIPGTLFSVQPLTTQHIPKIFTRNERLVMQFETSMGPLAVIFVGATIVGKIGTRWQGDLSRSKHIKDYQDVIAHWSVADKTLKKADELGYFKLGSTIILLFSKKIEWIPTLKVGMPIQLGEALVKTEG